MYHLLKFSAWTLLLRTKYLQPAWLGVRCNKKAQSQFAAYNSVIPEDTRQVEPVEVTSLDDIYAIQTVDLSVLETDIQYDTDKYFFAFASVRLSDSSFYCAHFKFL